MRKTLLWSSAALAIFVVALVAINAFDETLSEEARLLLQAPRTTLPPDQNLFVALAGFQAPSGTSPVAAGQAAIAEQARIAALPPGEGFAAYEKSLEAPLLTYKGKPLCQPLTESCWTDVSARTARIRRDLAANRELYQRYLQLHVVPSYAEVNSGTNSPIVAHVPRPVRALFAADVALRAKDATTVSHRAAALADLDRDLVTWRRALIGGPSLISAMVAVANLHGDHALLGDVVADPSINLAPHEAQIETMLARVKPDDWKMPSAIKNEFRLLAFFVTPLKDDATELLLWHPSLDDRNPAPWQRVLGPPLAHFFKLNATLNLAARHNTLMQKLASTDPADFLREKVAVRQWREENLGAGFRYVYNPIGKWLIDMAPDAWDGYPLRMYDGAALQRLVRLGYEIRKRRIPTEKIPVFMTEHPEWSTHPVNGEAFVFDAAAHELALIPLGATPKDRRFRIPVWRAG